MKKILFIVPHRMNRSPGQRFRIELFLEHLKNSGFCYTYSYMISAADDKHFYAKGKYGLKFYILLKTIFRRLRDVIRAGQYDFVFIYREAFFPGTIIFERLYKLSRAKIIYDFDDAIWLNDTSEGNQNLAWLKNASKYGKIMKLSDMVFAGNQFLADYARQFNKNVKIIPTVIDTSYHYVPIIHKPDDAICIGWTGSSTTLRHFETAIPFLSEIKKKYGEKVRFKVIVNIPYSNIELGLTATNWNIKTEISDLQEIDIGIMPLPDDDWSRGKCGFKGLQYMALEIPTIMSPVGVNSEIITDGENGFLAASNEEWINKLALLIENSELRKKLGSAGRKTVIEKYSVNSQKDFYVKYLDELL